MLFRSYHTIKKELGELQHRFDLQADLLSGREREIEKVREELAKEISTNQRIQRQLRDANYRVESLSEQIAAERNEKQVIIPILIPIETFNKLTKS